MEFLSPTIKAIMKWLGSGLPSTDLSQASERTVTETKGVGP